jgi:7,8-dihydroneopterin aldolase/epimerase/oxygenase
MDEIILNGMQFYGYHGVFPEETVTGQRFIVDVRLRLNLTQAGKTDLVKHTVDYGKVYEVVKSVVEGEPKKLIESVAETIADTLFTQFLQLENVSVQVQKPGAPIPGIFESVCVRIERTR